MDLDLRKSKTDLRALIAARLAAIPAHDLAPRSHAAIDRLIALPQFQAAQTTLLYWPAPTLREPDLAPLLASLLARGRRVCFPRVGWTTKTLHPVLVDDPARDLIPDPARPGSGLMSPRIDLPELPPAALDFILVPGIAFDPTGHRLGRGGGFYDRFLAGVSAAIPTAAIAFDEQITPHVPRGTTDIPIRLIVTPSRVIQVLP